MSAGKLVTIPAEGEKMIDIYERRREKTQPYLYGKGVEIGAGTSPQDLPDGCEALYFDKRDKSELSNYFGEEVTYKIHSFDDFSNYFPNGADFLIAHHVLEHTPDPIATLRHWHTYVKPAGVFVISVPYFTLCPDRDRLEPDFNHILTDHLLDRDGDSFESREHVLSFLSSWVDDSPGLADLTKSECCRKILSQTKRSGHDFHWHAFDHRLFQETIYAAALFDDQVPEFYETTTQDEDCLDILFVYSLKSITPENLSEDAKMVIAAARSIKNKIYEKVSKLEQIAL